MAHAEDQASEGFLVRVASAARVEVGKEIRLSLSILPRGGYSVSADGPVAIDLGVGDRAVVQVPKERYRRRDAADPGAEAPRFEFRVRGLTPGETELLISLSFWLCREYSCRPIETSHSVRVESHRPLKSDSDESEPS